MKITELESLPLRLDDVDPTRADDTQDAFLVRVHTDEGVVGIGEADTPPSAARAIIEMPSSALDAQGLRDILLGRDPLDTGLWNDMYWGTYYYGRSGMTLHVISALDIALWDIRGKAMGQPVHSLLGGRRRSSVRAYASALMPDTESGIDDIAALASGEAFPALKLGWGPLGKSPHRDAELILYAADALPGVELMIDLGKAYREVDEARSLLRSVADAHLYWLEEPFPADDYENYAELCRESAVPIAAGEEASNIREFRDLLERGGIHIVQPDLSRCGGFTTAVSVARMADEIGTQIVPHCFSSGVLIAASVHFASTLDRLSYCEFPVTRSPLLSELLQQPCLPENGEIAVPDGPGLGIELDESIIERYKVP